jgi:putative hemolysin
MNLLLIEITILSVFALLSAFFSGSETALFSLKKSDLYRFSKSKNRRENNIYWLMQDPQKVLVTILAGNLFVNLAISELSTYLFLQVWDDYGHFISIAIVTPILIIMCEITPKIISVNMYESVSKRVYPLLNIFHNMLYPVRVVLISITNVFIGIFRLRFTHINISEDELGHILNVGLREGVVDKTEVLFIHNVMRFSKRDASNVMFPRNSAVFIPHGATLDEAAAIFLDSGVIRAPVFKNDYDTIVGFIDSREMLPHYFGYRSAININRFIHRIHFFPASRSLNDLLSDFQSQGIQIAIIIDEYGGTAGVVTLNSILMELMGRESTKWEIDYKPEIRKIDNDISIVSGAMQIDDFNFHFDETIYSRDSDSIGGYIMEIISSLPKRGQEIMTDKHVLRVRYIRKNKIETVEIIKRNTEGLET